MISIIDQTACRPVNLATIEKSCQAYESDAAELETSIRALELELEQVKSRHLGKIKRQAAAVATSEAALRNQIEASPGLFIKPRTLTIHGIKVGYTTSKGSVVFADEESVIKRIRQFLAGEEDTYIRTKESVDKDAVRTLDAADLKRIGCTIEGQGDTVVVTRTSGEVEKLINKLVTKLVESLVAPGE